MITTEHQHVHQQPQKQQQKQKSSLQFRNTRGGSRKSQTNSRKTGTILPLHSSNKNKNKNNSIGSPTTPSKTKPLILRTMSAMNESSSSAPRQRKGPLHRSYSDTHASSPTLIRSTLGTPSKQPRRLSLSPALGSPEMPSILTDSTTTIATGAAISTSASSSSSSKLCVPCSTPPRNRRNRRLHRSDSNHSSSSSSSSSSSTGPNEAVSSSMWSNPPRMFLFCNTWICGFALIAVLLYCSLTRSLQAATEATDAMMVVRDRMNVKLHGESFEVMKLSREASAAQRRLDQQQQELRQLQQKEANQGMAERESAEQSLQSLRQHLEESNVVHQQRVQQVQNFSRQAVMEKHGPGPHRVRIDLVFPDGTDGSFVVEMAPLDVMPHSVHVFLEMVSQGLWDGCSFVMNALHIVKTAALPFDDHDTINHATAFLEAGLNGPSFAEDSAWYPHKRYTLGFAGGHSPSFYINTQDNSNIHAGDAAFAKVVDGNDTVGRLEAEPTTNGGIWFQQRIGIRKMTILTP